MIVGRVTEDRVPTIQLPVAGNEWPAVIDTGFNGDLELPESLRPFPNARFRSRQPWLLAGGQSIEEDSYSVDFPFEGQTIFAEATFVPGGTILLGTHFIRRYRLTIDFVAQTVLLDRVA
jgi:hypothetical protein